jgi:hypothetical protein
MSKFTRYYAASSAYSTPLLWLRLVSSLDTPFAIPILIATTLEKVLRIGLPLLLRVYRTVAMFTLASETAFARLEVS